MNAVVRGLIALFVLTLALTPTWPASAQQYPNKPVKILIPFAAGGVTDIAGRLDRAAPVGTARPAVHHRERARRRRQSRHGQCRKSAADGYTILLASSSIVVNPSLYAKVPYDIDKDFIPVTKAGGTPNSWVVTRATRRRP